MQRFIPLPGQGVCTVLEVQAVAPSRLSSSFSEAKVPFDSMVSLARPRLTGGVDFIYVDIVRRIFVRSNQTLLWLRGALRGWRRWGTTLASDVDAAMLSSAEPGPSR